MISSPKRGGRGKLTFGESQSFDQTPEARVWLFEATLHCSWSGVAFLVVCFFGSVGKWGGGRQRKQLVADSSLFLASHLGLKENQKDNCFFGGPRGLWKSPDSGDVELGAHAYSIALPAGGWRIVPSAQWSHNSLPQCNTVGWVFSLKPTQRGFPEKYKRLPQHGL